MSYDGHLGFGLLGDYDALPDLDKIALDLQAAIASLAKAAGVRPRAGRSGAPGSARKAKASASNGTRGAAKQASGQRGSVTKPARAS
jgi:hypothetical protein